MSGKEGRRDGAFGLSVYLSDGGRDILDPHAAADSDQKRDQEYIYKVVFVLCPLCDALCDDFSRHTHGHLFDLVWGGGAYRGGVLGVPWEKPVPGVDGGVRGCVCAGIGVGSFIRWVKYRYAKTGTQVFSCFCMYHTGIFFVRGVSSSGTA